MYKKKVLITGGCGFIGINATQRFLEAGYETHVFCKQDVPSTFTQYAELHTHKVDVRNAEAVEDTVTSISPDYVIHLAASNISSGTITSSEDVIVTNVLGTESMLKASEKVGVKSFIGMGSFLEYGPSASPFKEDNLCNPLEIYSISKLGQTLLTQSYGRLKKMNATVFRLFTPYGPHIQKGRLIENVIRKSLMGEEIQLTSKSVSRDFVYVDDIVDIFFEVIENPEKHSGEVYNLASGQSRNLGEVVEVIQRQTGTKSKLVWGKFKDVLYDTDTCVASMDKVFKHLSWRPKTSFEDGITKTINSVKANIDY